MGHDWCLFFISGIPEDPLVAEEYYTDVFESCSEESEKEEGEMVFSGLEEEAAEEGLQPDHRTNQQVLLIPARSGGIVWGTDRAVTSQRESRKSYNLKLGIRGWGRGRARVCYTVSWQAL